jgi:hypothetical protein
VPEVRGHCPTGIGEGQGKSGPHAGSAHYREAAFWHISGHFQRTAGSAEKPIFLDVFGVFRE